MDEHLLASGEHHDGLHHAPHLTAPSTSFSTVHWITATDSAYKKIGDPSLEDCIDSKTQRFGGMCAMSATQDADSAYKIMQLVNNSINSAHQSAHTNANLLEKAGELVQYLAHSRHELIGAPAGVAQEGIPQEPVLPATETNPAFGAIDQPKALPIEKLITFQQAKQVSDANGNPNLPVGNKLVAN